MKHNKKLRRVRKSHRGNFRLRIQKSFEDYRKNQVSYKILFRLYRSFKRNNIKMKFPLKNVIKKHKVRKNKFKARRTKSYSFYFSKLVGLNSFFKNRLIFKKNIFNFNKRNVKVFLKRLFLNRKIFKLKKRAIRNFKLKNLKKKLKWKLFLRKSFIKVFGFYLKKSLQKGKGITVALKEETLKSYLNYLILKRKSKGSSNIDLELFKFLSLIQLRAALNCIKDFKNLNYILPLVSFKLILERFLKINTLMSLNEDFSTFNHLSFKMINHLLKFKWLKNKLYKRLKYNLLQKVKEHRVVERKNNLCIILPKTNYDYIEMNHYFKIYRKLRNKLRKRGRKRRSMYLLFNKLTDIFNYKVRKLRASRYYISIQKTRLPQVGLFMI
ncbi:hypothetical protein SAMD00019534_126850, partial [Acytostelium subglobosum LB1]|uniref:hypothetical protein n=1 Tax=Acytostelium subglobosum LB1 TaxID=1410327 RepID=UPI000644AD9F